MLQVEIKVKGQIDDTWSDWFEGMTITHADKQVTTITGSIADEAALYGLLGKLRDLGLKLLLVNSCAKNGEKNSNSG